MEMGLIQVYTGDGKGKTTAAIGQAVRAAGQGLKVAFVTFFKEPELYSYGEFYILEKIGVKCYHFAKKHPYFFRSLKFDEVRKECLEGLKFVNHLYEDYYYDMIVLDELNIAVRDGFLNNNEVLKIIRAKPPTLELIITGRGRNEELEALADIISEVRKIKHPYDKGIKGRKGIEY